MAHGTIPRCCGFPVAVLLAGSCALETPDEVSLDDLTLAFSEPTCFQPEQRLSASPVLPDSIFGRINHLDLHADAFAVVDAIGKFAAVISYDLDILQVMGRPGQGPGELVGPVAARIEDDRVLVMDQASRRIWAYPRNPSEGAGASPDDAESAADLRGAAGVSMGTDFVVLNDNRIGIPVHEEPTYLMATAGPGRPGGEPTRDIGPAHPDETSLKQMRRIGDRVAAFGDGVMVWDDDEATLILAADDQEKRWRLPDRYSAPDEPQPSVGPGGRGIAFSLGRPTLAGWTVADQSVCMAARPSGTGDEVDLLWLALDGETDSPPVLRRIGTRGLEDPVSCGFADDRLLIVTETEIVMSRLDESEPCQLAMAVASATVIAEAPAISR